MNVELQYLAKKASELSDKSAHLADKIKELSISSVDQIVEIDHFLPLFTIFILACFVGYYVVWKVTPALHTPLMSVTNAISGIIIIGSLIAAGFEDLNLGSIFGFISIFLASINIFGGFIITERMLSMFKKKVN